MSHLKTMFIFASLLFLITSCEPVVEDSTLLNEIDTSGVWDSGIEDSVISFDTVYVIDTLNGTAVLDDGYEPDNDILHATPIALNEIQAHRLNPNNGDWFTTTVDSGEIYEIIVANEFSTNYMISSIDVVNSEGIEKDYNISTGSGTYGAKAVFHAEITGEIFFLVSSYSDSAGTYAVRIRTIPKGTPDSFESDNTPQEAIALSIENLPQIHTLTFNDVDWVSFKGDSGKTYQFTTVWDKNAYGFTRRMTLHDENMRNLQNEYGSSSSTIELKWSCNTSGTYYLSTAGFEGNETTYSITYREISAGIKDLFEPDDNLDNASEITIGDSAQLHTLTINDTDWSYINVDSGSYYRLETISNSDTYRVWTGIYLEDIRYRPQTTGYRTDSSSISFFKSEYNGKMLLKTYHSISDTTSYYISVDTINEGAVDEYEPDNSMYVSSKLEAKNEVQNRTLTVLDEDYIEIPVDSGLVYTAEFTFDNETSYVYPYFYDELGRTLSYDFEINNSRLVVQWRCDEKTTRFIRLRSHSYVPIGYTVKLSIN